MDIRSGFIQASGFNRVVFVKTLKEADELRGLWRLTADAYVLVDIGRLWYRTRDRFLVSEN